MWQAIGRNVHWLVAYTAAILSAAFAARYGAKNADTWLDGALVGAVLCVVAIVATHSLMWSVKAWRRGSRLFAVIVVLAGLVCFGVTLAGGIGTIAYRADKGDAERARSIGDRKALERDQARKTAARDKLGTVRPRAAIDAEIASVKLQKAWASSGQCQDVTVRASREFCEGYNRLIAEAGNADAVAKLDEELAGIAGRLADRGTVAAKAANPQAEALARILRLEQSADAEAWYAFAVSFAVEIAAMISLAGTELLSDGPARRIAHQRRRRLVWQRKAEIAVEATSSPAIEAKPVPAIEAPRAVERDERQSLVVRLPVPTKRKAGLGSGSRIGRVVVFLADALERQPGAKTCAGDILAAYKAWCAGNGLLAMTDEAFAGELARVVQKLNLRCEAEGATIYVVDMRLAA